MSDPRINPNYKGVKCPGCGERLPFLLTDLCSHCTHERDRNEIERLQKRNALLEDVAAAAEEFDKVLYGNSSKWAAVMGALDKLKKVSDE